MNITASPLVPMQWDNFFEELLGNRYIIKDISIYHLWRITTEGLYVGRDINKVYNFQPGNFPLDDLAPLNIGFSLEKMTLSESKFISITSKL